MENCTFENEDIISVDSVSEKEKVAPVLTELDRGNKLYDLRLLMKTTRKGQLKPLYDEARKKNDKLSKIAVYKLVCSTKKSKDTEYPECSHVGNIIIDRDILSQQEHIEFLAEPKKAVSVPPRKYKMRCHFIKKYLPNTTTHVEELAIPKKIKAEITLEHFAKVLSARHIDNLTKLLLPEETDFVNIEKAINLRREENKKKLVRKAKILRESAKVKRKIIKARKEQVREITYGIFEMMKTFLMTEHKIDMSEGMVKLSEVLECKIKSFTGMFNSCELVEKFLKTLAKNLAIWMEKFISNFGFESLIESIYSDKIDICPCEERELRRQLPIDDYIEMSEEEEMPEEIDIPEEFEGEYNWEEYWPSEEGFEKPSLQGTAAQDVTENEEGEAPAEEKGEAPAEEKGEAPAEGEGDE